MIKSRVINLLKTPKEIWKNDEKEFIKLLAEPQIMNIIQKI